MPSIMGVPRGLLFLLILQIWSRNSSGTLVFSCDSCNDQAYCVESQERGATNASQGFTCVCKDGFVGDGFTCYNTKLCSDSSCCSQGYGWSPDKGCVDIDECSLPDSPCAQTQVCANIPGSFTCIERPPRSRFVRSPSTVQFNCGNTPCPPGMDCIDGNRCADPCDHYTVLADDWRSVNNTDVSLLHCDRALSWQGWYRMFLGNESAHIPESCVEMNRCGTNAPLWITQPHPTRTREIVQRTVCNHWNNDCCHFASHNIHVKLCYGGYYVYKLVVPVGCFFAYCADVNRTAVLPTTPPTTTVVPPTKPNPPMKPALPTTENFPATNESHLPPQIAHLVCGRDEIQVGLNVSATASRGLDPSSGHLAVLNCSTSGARGGVVWYKVAAEGGACGNILTTNRTHATYFNRLFLYPTNYSLSRPVSLSFSCVYPLDTNASLNMALKPVLGSGLGDISGSGARARASMFLFRNSNFTDAYTGNLVCLPVGYPLYVGIYVDERDPSFVLVVEDCYLTPSANPQDTRRYFLIQNKCPTNHRQVSVVESGSSSQARFSALFFPPQSEYQNLYLHCSLSLCDQRSYNCVPNCRGRKYRSVSNSTPLQPVSIGPITWDKSLQ